MTDATAAAALLARKTRSGHRASTTRLVHQAATAMEAEVDNDQLSLTGVAEQGVQSPPPPKDDRRYIPNRKLIGKINT